MVGLVIIKKIRFFQMQFMDMNATMRKTLASYEKIGVRRMARSDNHNKRSTKFYIDLTNLWRTNSQDQNKQYKAIRDSELFSDGRTVTFLKFNYRNYEPGTYGYGAAYGKIKRKGTMRLGHKGTMQVADLWGEETMQQVIGSPAFPRDRLKMLRIWGQKSQKEISSMGGGGNKRILTLP